MMSIAGFIYFVVFVVLGAACIAKFLVPRSGNTNIIVYISICSTIGSLSVVCCKGLGLYIRESYLGTSLLLNWKFILLLLFLITCICVQMNYLNRALDVFNTAIVNPIYYVFFTSAVIIASAILFQEWKHMEAVDAVASIVGFLIVIIAIFILSAFKDIRISLLDLHSNKRTRIESIL